MSLKEQIASLKEQELELFKARLALEEGLKEEARLAWATIRLSYDYRAVARGPYGLRVERKASAAYLLDIAAFKVMYEQSKNQIDVGWYGMDYWLVGNVLIQSGGGTVILHFGSRARGSVFFNQPVELTPDEVEAFNNGEVPKNLRYEPQF